MANYRRDRINVAVARELNIALQNVRDPRIAGNFVTVTRAEVSPDLRNATIYYSAMGDAKEVRTALIRCTGHLRHCLAETVNLRITPELVFIHDTSIQHGARIAELLEQIHEKDAPAETTEEADDGL